MERRVRLFWASLHPLPREGQIGVVGHRGSLAILRAVISGVTLAEAFASRLELADAVALAVN